jgi:hypothetical protein
MTKEFVDFSEFIQFDSFSSHFAFIFLIVKAEVFSESLSSPIVTSLDSFA